MKQFLRNHPESILIVLAIVFLGTIIFSFTWGMGQVVEQVDRAVNAKGAGTASVEFDIPGAAKLDYRGLVKTSP